MNEEKSDADIMADAREYIEKNGWWRGSLVGPNGSQVCGLGGIAGSQGWLVQGKNGGVPWEIAAKHQDRVFGIAKKVITTLEPEWDFVRWNDDIAKTKQEVLDTFAKAEKIERTGFDPDKGITEEEAWQ